MLLSFCNHKDIHHGKHWRAAVIGPRAMKRAMLGCAATSAVTTASAASAQAAPMECAGLKQLKLPHVEILIASPVSGTFREDMQVERAARTFTGLRSFWRVRGISRPVAGSAIGFEVWLPPEQWSGRLHMIGNGAYVSNISYKQMIARLDDNDVAVATATGHTGTDLRFGWKHRERIVDFGPRAVHESVVAAKAITRAFYGRAARWSYFRG